MKQSGLWWHVHHDMLFEYCYDAEERVEFIKEHKHPSEIATRLWLMKPIKGKLGDSEARDAYAKAWDANDKAGDAYAKAWDAYYKARDANDKARDAYYKARDANAKAGAAFLDTIKPGEAEALHAIECKECPWDETTIFPEKGESSK